MKHKLLIFLSLFMLMPTLAMAQATRRVVYLWDVTYSMHGGRLGSGDHSVVVGDKQMVIKGYNQSRDIYDKILKALISDIDNQSENTEIVVVPFNDKALTSWEATGSKEGKEKLKSEIRKFYNEQQTRTGISKVLEYSQQKNIFSNKVPNILKVLTDGEESVSTAALDNILSKWCAYAEANNITSLYFVLAEDALKEDLRKKLEDGCFRIIVQLDDVELAVAQSYVSVAQENFMVRVAEERDKSFTFHVNFTEGEKGANCKLRFKAEDNSYFTLDEVKTVSAQTKTITLKPKYAPYEQLRQMPSDKPVEVRIHVTKESDDKVEFQPTESTVTLVNKRLKALKISVKK